MRVQKTLKRRESEHEGEEASEVNSVWALMSFDV